MRNKKNIIVLFSTLIFLLFTTPVGAITSPGSDKGLGCGGGLGPLGEALCAITKGSVDPVGNALNRVLSGIIGFLTVVGGLWFFIQFILAGYAWISSGGDKSRVEAAQQKITNSLIGLLVVVAAWVIIGVIGKIVGLDILNPGAILPILGL